MENWKQYLPWIIGAAIVLYAFSRFRQRTILAPQTQITQTPQPDAYLDARTSAFTSLVGLANTISAQDTIRGVESARQETARILGLAGEETTRLQSANALTVANRSFDTDIALANIYASVQNTLNNLNLLSRNQDRMLQQGAIDRYYSSRNLDSIVGSISGALSNIFGNRSGTGSIFRGTPPTFPGFTF